MCETGIAGDAWSIVCRSVAGCVERSRWGFLRGVTCWDEVCVGLVGGVGGGVEVIWRSGMREWGEGGCMR